MKEGRKPEYPEKTRGDELHWYDPTRKKLRAESWVRTRVCRCRGGRLTTRPPRRFDLRHLPPPPLPPTPTPTSHPQFSLLPGRTSRSLFWQEEMTSFPHFRRVDGTDDALLRVTKRSPCLSKAPELHLSGEGSRRITRYVRFATPGAVCVMSVMLSSCAHGFPSPPGREHHQGGGSSL